MFSGSMPALVTPFDANLKIDEAAFSRHVDWVISEGCSGVVPVGTTGESATLSHDEHNRVVEISVEQTDGRVPVIAGAGSNNTVEAIELVVHAEKCGADGLLVVTPYYNRPTQAGLYQHFKLIAEATKLPILVYNIPGRCAVDMNVNTMAALAKDFSNIIGVKDATADMARVSQTRAACGPDFCQMSAEDASALGFYAHGGVGCISVTTNVVPKLTSQFQAALAAGDFPKALELQDLLMPLHDAVFSEPGVAGVKYALSKLGRMENTLRSPMLPVTAETAGKIDAALKHVGIEA